MRDEKLLTRQGKIRSHAGHVRSPRGQPSSENPIEKGPGPSAQSGHSRHFDGSEERNGQLGASARAFAGEYRKPAASQLDAFLEIAQSEVLRGGALPIRAPASAPVIRDSNREVRVLQVPDLNLCLLDTGMLHNVEQQLPHGLVNKHEDVIPKRTGGVVGLNGDTQAMLCAKLVRQPLEPGNQPFFFQDRWMQLGCQRA